MIMKKPIEVWQNVRNLKSNFDRSDMNNFVRTYARVTKEQDCEIASLLEFRLKAI